MLSGAIFLEIVVAGVIFTFIILQYLKSRQVIAILVGAVLITNHFINAVILRYFGNNWQDSIYGGALLAQIGELSFM